MNVSNDESIQDYPLVIVKWKDAVINEEYSGHFCDLYPLPVESSGFLVLYDNARIIIIQSAYEDGQYNTLTIPTGWTEEVIPMSPGEWKGKPKIFPESINTQLSFKEDIDVTAEENRPLSAQCFE